MHYVKYRQPGEGAGFKDMSKHGKPCEEGYDSHVVHVRKRKREGSYHDDFFPDSKENSTADELVVFHSNQILPWFLVL
jgi:hypothetical protein